MDEQYDGQRRPWIGWALAALVVVLALAGWLVVRGIGAAHDLTGAARASDQLRAAIVAGHDHQFDTLAARVADHTASAASLTSDPVWRAVEHFPVVGDGMTTLGDLAEASDVLAQGALPLLLSVSEELDLGTLGVGGNGRVSAEQEPPGASLVDLSAYPTVSLRLARAGAAAERSAALIRNIDPDAATGLPRDVIVDAHHALTDAQRRVRALSGAARLLPGMLGEQGTRTYLLAVHNGADVRPGGGVIETVVQLEASQGAITVVGTASARVLPAAPVAVPDALRDWIDDGVPLHELARVPSFPDAAPLIAAHWTHYHGGHVDGVIAVDAAVLPGVLAATGGIGFAGYSVDAASVIETLMIDMPRDRSAADQAAAFTDAVTAAVNAMLTRATPATLVAGLADAADAGHIRIWSANPAEQAVFAASDLGGVVPSAGAAVGVLIEDTTGGRMGAFVSGSATVAVGECNGDRTTQVTVTWSNEVELDEEAPLPEVVTGAADEGFGAGGAVRARIGVYGPTGATALGGGADDGMIGARPLVWREVVVPPGAAETVSVAFRGAGGAGGGGTPGGAGERVGRMPHTPLLGGMDVTRVPLECG